MSLEELLQISSKYANDPDNKNMINAFIKKHKLFSAFNKLGENARTLSSKDMALPQ